MMPKWPMRQLDAGSRARGNPSRAVPARAVRAGVALVLVIPHLTGCYHHVQIRDSGMPPGALVSVGVTDRGRVALSDHVGPGVRRITGRALESTDSALVLSVTSVEHFDQADPARWAGERVEVSRDFVSDIRERRLSRSRTGLMAVLVAAAAVAVSFIAVSAGFGGDPGGDRPPGGSEPE